MRVGEGSNSLLVILLGLATIFAIGAVLAFVTVLFSGKSREGIGIPPPLTIEERTDIVNSLAPVEPTTDTPVGEEQKQDILQSLQNSDTQEKQLPPPSTTSPNPASASEADPNDANAAAKLQILQSLNSQ